MQFKAGYIADCIAKIISDYTSNLDTINKPQDFIKLNQINGLLKYASSFDVQFPYKHNPEYKNLNPVISAINNIITRGLPTRAPIEIENIFNQLLLTNEIDNPFEIDYSECNHKLDFETVFELLHIIEPKLEISRNNYGGNLGSDPEWEFIKKHPFLKQLLESQRDFSTINAQLKGNKSVDFCFTSPYLHWNEELKKFETIGRIFEVDGKHHSLSEHRYYDAYRDAIAEEENFETLRYTVENIREDKIDFESLIGRKLYSIFNKNYQRNFKSFINEYSLIFIPFAVARIQKTLLEHFLVNIDLFSRKSIKVAIVERDFPCGAIAIKSLKEIFNNINALIDANEQLTLPKIELTIFENKDWVLSKNLHLDEKIGVETDFSRIDFDIIIDHSILRRTNIYRENTYVSDRAIKIRSTHYFDNSFGNARRVYCAELIKYNPLVKKNQDGSYAPIAEHESHINYFIQHIFRKQKFNEGQLPIISRAIQLKPVIGLLPTGGGKSLTFQLPAFLQPGLCLVVDPIKSLMEDQVRVLKENWIDCCEFINSNLGREDRLRKIIDFRYGETMFLFVSPERFVMEDFRNIIHKIDSSKFGLAFSYCVIDEVHCVSEWGHDFRTTYLMLGKNAQTYAKTKSGSPISLIGLTATASFDVLADIERELQIKHNDVAEAIIMIENTIRPELFFRVIDVTDENRISILNDDFSRIGYNLQKLNSTKLINDSISHHKTNFNLNEQVLFDNILFRNGNGSLVDLSNKSHNDFFSIIFCPVKGLFGSPIGVSFVFSELNSNSKGFFYSSDTNEENSEVQEHFKKFTTNKTKHIVCTKAFGMGIDKKDIRSTYHYVYSNSLESLVQEAGRAGRDKKVAESVILVSKEKYYILDVFKFFKFFNNDINIKNKFIRKAIRETFDKKWNDNSGKFDKIIFNTTEQVIETIESLDFSLVSKKGKSYNNLTESTIIELRNKLKFKNEKNEYVFIFKNYKDREIHNFFHSNSFKGIDVEKSQFVDLFNEREFQVTNFELNYLEGQGSLRGTFESCKKKTFDFLITAEKKYPSSAYTICEILDLQADLPIKPPYYMATFGASIQKALDFSKDFNDFIFSLDEKGVVSLEDIEESYEELYKVFYRNRENSNDTGRLIYRMHSAGFLIDYKIDYNKNNLYICTFAKYNSIDNYIEKIEEYLRRYLSEISAIESIDNLRMRLNKPTLIDNIIECLFFLSEFSYQEIESKRRRATDEIENILYSSISDKVLSSDWFQQNLYLKEQIYFYFNAKYSRIDFQIEGKPYSLLSDYKNPSISKTETLYKYLEVFPLDGAEQNNYKHMIGSCKKIIRSLSDTDLEKEWMLRLLKAFSMYSVNNESYISEANTNLEEGFDKLYSDKEFASDFNLIEPIFDSYFKKLVNNIDKDNRSFNEIKLIRLKLLIKMQSIGIDRLVLKNKQLNTLNYA